MQATPENVASALVPNNLFNCLVEPWNRHTPVSQVHLMHRCWKLSGGIVLRYQQVPSTAQWESLQHGWKALMLQVTYQVQLSDGSHIRVDLVVVFSQPVGMQQEQWQRQPDKALAAGNLYQWAPVTRGQPYHLIRMQQFVRPLSYR